MDDTSSVMAVAQPLSPDRVDAGKVSQDSQNIKAAGKPDTRNSVTYTFVGTGEESFLHALTYIPTGAIIESQNKAATISYNKTKWTNRRVYMTSSVAANQVTFVFY